jgi:phospholipase D1/2
MTDFPYYPDDPFAGIPLIEAIEPIAPVPPIGRISPIRQRSRHPPAPRRRRPDPLAEPFFLPPVITADPMIFRGAWRDALAITPLVDGEKIFTEIEQAIMAATSSVLIAMWAMDPDMKPVAAPNPTWRDMLTAAASRGVLVRVLLTDFDPGLQLAQHVTAWRAYFKLVAAAKTVPSDKFQVICSHHAAETSDKVIALARPGLYDKLAQELNSTITDPKQRLVIFSAAPGLWDKLNLDLATGKLTPKVAGKDYPAWPAVHHQKLVVVDGKLAFAGGLNLTSAYVDSPRHDKDPIPWHDLFVQVEGNRILDDVIRNFVGLWNQERPQAEAFLKNAYAALNVKAKPQIGPTSELSESTITARPTSAAKPKIPVQMHRTITTKSNAPSGLPTVVRQDVLDGYLTAIGQARDYIYLENQYFREQTVADAIIARHKDQPDLRTILVLPRVAEELLAGQGDELTKHGAAIQYELLTAMKAAIGTKLGLFTPVRKDHKQIYVHSKLCLIDDRFASISSANCNPRSFRVDTELGFVCYDAAASTTLRNELWREILGNPPTMPRWRPKQYIAKWSAIANRNLHGPAAAQQGFVVPFENTTKGTKSPLDQLTPFV